MCFKGLAAWYLFAGIFKGIVFQRYYGNSLPFGNSSFTPDNIGLLTIEQALGDYAVLISSLKTAMKAENCPVITFGGRYCTLTMLNPGSEVIKPFSCSTQLSTKFQLLKTTKIPTNEEDSLI